MTQIEALEPATATLTISLDCELYPREVLYAAAYVFLDRAYVLLDRQGPRYLVHLRAKQPVDEATLRAMAGELENELLAQALRLRVVRANQKIIEQITALAITGAAGVSYGDEGAEDSASLNAGASVDGFVEDPIGLGTPWEDRKRDA